MYNNSRPDKLERSSPTLVNTEICLQSTIFFMCNSVTIRNDETYAFHLLHTLFCLLFMPSPSHSRRIYSIRLVDGISYIVNGLYLESIFELDPQNENQKYASPKGNEGILNT